MSKPNNGPVALILGCAGPRLDAAERAFFRAADPLGFILFGRNIEDPPQVRALVDSLREAVGRAGAPILIDQEGGRVRRLRPPHWRAAPPAARFGALARHDLDAAARAAWLNARLMAAELNALGIDVDCAPVLDLPVEGAHGVIGDRAYGTDPAIVARLGRAAIDGFLAGGVLPVIKHLPGHGRAEVDSHDSCPVVSSSADALERSDLAPFRALRDAPLAMTAHVVFTAWDRDRPATLSATVIAEAIRGLIGFEGALISDDIGMKALAGDIGQRACLAQAAGCDLVLHCTGDREEMAAVVAATMPLAGPAAARVGRALARRRPPEPAEPAALAAELQTLLTTGEAAWIQA